MCKEHGYIVSVAEGQMEELTRRFGFRISADIKKLSLSDKLISQLETELASMFNKGQFGALIHQSECGKCIIRKTRHKNPSNNRGKSSGLRLITLLLEFENEEDIHCTIFHIFTKQGSHAKNNISTSEEDGCRNFIQYFIENNEGE